MQVTGCGTFLHGNMSSLDISAIAQFNHPMLLHGNDHNALLCMQDDTSKIQVLQLVEYHAP